METDGSNFSNLKLESTSSNSPILQRTSDFFDDFRYDSVSAISGSTICDSEFVERKIRQYEKQQNTAEATNNATVYNLRIDKFVIDAKAKNEEIDKQVVNQIISKLSTTKNNFKTRRDSKWFRIREKAVKPKFLLPSLLLLIVLIGISIGIPLATKKKDGFEVSNEETSQNPTSDSTSSVSTNSVSTTTSSTETTTSTSTTSTVKPEPIEQLKIIKKAEWEVSGLPLVAKFKQILPIRKIIVMTTKTEPCYDEETCIAAVVNLQQESYPDFDDIRENFLIATDGIIYEGRGFSREGEAAILEDTKTSFDLHAVSISFMVTDENQEPNSVQLETFCNFLNRSKSNEEIKENYKVFHQSSLISTNENLIENFEHCEVKWEKTPSFIRRREWNAKEFPLENDFYYRRHSSKVIIANTDGQSCDSIVSCGPIIKTLQSNGHSGEIDYNFIFSSENLIFEGRNFDAATNDFDDSLFILVLGKIDVVEKAEKVLKNINEFLKFAIDVSKLSQNYTIYGERQVRETSSPGNTLFSIIEKDIHFEAVFDTNCNKD